MAIKDFDLLLEKYADLIISTGIHVQKNDAVVIQISVEQAQLARLLTKKAYQAGAGEVILQWTDDVIQREFLTHADQKYIETVPSFRQDELNSWVDKKASRISVVSSDPDGLANVDTQRVATYQSAVGKASMNLRKATQANQVSWTVVAAAGAAWAKKVFPHLSSEKEQVDALWHEIFKTTRIYEADPVAAWHKHDQILASKAAELNAAQFDALHYTAPGTDLIIGLPHNHLWEGAGSQNAQGVSFMANMPTEEVFTAPDYRRVDGTVSSTKPLSYAGTTISGMKFTFKEGKVVAFSAEQGEAVLAKLLDTDAQSRYLGEVALVPDPSPISQSGITFYNTLFDENASNHLAFGSAYAFSIVNGTKMSEEELKAAGLNRSQTHVDFMIGSNQMNIDGITKDGQRIPIFRQGDWA